MEQEGIISKDELTDRLVNLFLLPTRISFQAVDWHNVECARRFPEIDWKNFRRRDRLIKLGDVPTMKENAAGLILNQQKRGFINFLISITRCVSFLHLSYTKHGPTKHTWDFLDFATVLWLLDKGILVLPAFRGGIPAFVFRDTHVP